MSDRSFELRTANVDKIRQVMAGLFCPFQLTADSAAYDARLRHDALGALSFTTLAYGNGIDIDVDERQSRFLIQIPLTGAFDARTTGPGYRTTPMSAHLAPPTVAPDIVPLTGPGTTLGHYVEFLYAESRRPDSLLRYGQNALPAVQM